MERFRQEAQNNDKDDFHFPGEFDVMPDYFYELVLANDVKGKKAYTKASIKKRLDKEIKAAKKKLQLQNKNRKMYKTQQNNGRVEKPKRKNKKKNSDGESDSSSSDSEEEEDAEEEQAENEE